MTLQPEIYHQYIPTIFKEYEIPFYIDEEQLMAQHPLVEFLNAFFACADYGFRLNDIFRLLRTELYLPPAFQQQEDWLAARDTFRQLVDITENQALAHNFQGKDWTRERDWLLVDYTLTGENASGIAELTDYTNQLRRYFRQDIFGSLKTFKRQRQTGKLQVLYTNFTFSRC